MRLTGRTTSDPAPIGDYQAGVVHDFRNMLQIAVSAISTTKRRIQSAEPDLATALDLALVALDKVNLFASHLCVSMPAPQTAPLFLQVLLPDLESLIRQALGDRIQLQIFAAHDLPALRCDRHELESALLNLVVNARDAMVEGGTLEISATACSECHHDGTCIALTVSDTGHGMAPEVVARAFDLHFTTKRARGGSGIGLHNVGTFAERLGGFVELVSTVEAGTRVRLHLPSDPNPSFG